MRVSRIAATAAFTITTATLAACSAPAPAPDTEIDPGAATGTVTVITHDSFYVADEALAAFEASSGLTVQFVAPGDAGTLVNELILTKDAPLGDLVYGVDNTFASRATAEGVFASYTAAAPAATDARAYSVTEGDTFLTAIDYSDVCLNIDTAYFATAGIEEPVSLDDLTKPEYRGLLSITNPATSSPGLAFMLATIAAKEETWPQYWADLRENDVRITSSWSDTYYTDFSAPNYGGDYPIVLSYASSIPFEVIDGEPTTAALLDTCFRQVEYAGILEGAANPDGAAAVLEWMLSDDFQSALPEGMYVFPVSNSVALPAEWAQYAKLSDDPWYVDADTIAANRSSWIKEWTTVVLD